MSNINIRDSVYQAIEEYNKLVKRPNCQKLTDNEKRGMFYTILRRYISAISSPNEQRGRGIHVDDLSCTFKENGELSSFKVKRDFISRGWDYSNVDILQAVKTIGESHKVFHKTPIMNEIANIVNQIK